MEASETTTARSEVRVAVDPSGIPEYLTIRPQWVAWTFEERKGKLTKVPYDVKWHEPAQTDDLMTWASFEDAFATYKLNDLHGIGFVFCNADPFIGLDLDGCLNPWTGEVDQWAREIIDGFEQKYVEVSPSGRGVHIIVKGKFDERGIHKGPFEMYSQGRFFAVTGVRLP